jgi:hypothetical protein
MSAFSSLVKYTRFSLSLRGYLKNQVTLEQAEQVVRLRIGDREKNFLNLVHKGIYHYPDSPYLKLLKEVGCEYEDIKNLVEKSGIESALQKLFQEGVYISWEEFKCKQDVVRGSKHFHFKESDFDNPFLPSGYQVQSTGSRSAGTRTTFDLSHREDESYYHLLMLKSSNALDVPIVMWKPLPPSASGISNILLHWKVGKPITKWFSPVDENQARTSLMHKIAVRYIIYSGRLWGAKLAYPEPVSLHNAVKVAQYIETTKKQFGGCSLTTSVSPALLVVEAALSHGVNIKGTNFFVSGEPLTEAKYKRMMEAEVQVSPRYSITEVGRVGVGCSQRQSVDEVHLLHDSTALIQHKRRVKYSNIEVDAFLFSSILESAPKILFNVECDDYGIVENKNCGCILGQVGYRTHIRNIRSYSKLTGSGMTIMGSELVRTLEVTLPKKYGGSPIDYQILEEEDDKGHTSLSLIVSPNIGSIDEKDIINTFLDDLRNNAEGGKLAAGFWSQMNTIKVKRMYPLSKAGKVMTLHLLKTK